MYIYTYTYIHIYFLMCCYIAYSCCIFVASFPGSAARSPTAQLPLDAKARHRPTANALTVGNNPGGSRQQYATGNRPHICIYTLYKCIYYVYAAVQPATWTTGSTASRVWEECCWNAERSVCICCPFLTKWYYQKLCIDSVII